MTELSTFILDHSEQILADWDAFARGLDVAEELNVIALRDHAQEMLRAIALAMSESCSAAELRARAASVSESGDHLPPTAAQQHGRQRAETGFTIVQMTAEFRALRASVTRLWAEADGNWRPENAVDLIRFNDALDQALAESIARYEQNVKAAQERFLAILGHDLRNPLSAILTSVSFMLDVGDLEASNRSLVERIASSSRRMNEMVLDLIEFARTQLGGHVPVERKTMDAGHMLQEVVAELEAARPGTDVRATTEGDLQGCWDGARLTQVLTNLVSNALEHGASDTPVTVAARGTEREVVFTVHNDGPPIPQEKRRTIFDPMKGAGGGESRQSGHLGLGLYIAEQIVRAHGGELALQSSADDGTTFTVRIPKWDG